MPVWTRSTAGNWRFALQQLCVHLFPFQSPRNTRYSFSARR